MSYGRSACAHNRGVSHDLGERLHGRTNTVTEYRHHRGFTLVELLMAVAILSLVAGLAAGGLRFGTAAWERSQAQNVGAGSGALEFLQRILGRIYPLHLDGMDREEIWLEGDATRLDFVSQFPHPWSDGSLYRSRLTVEPVGRGLKQLVLEWCPLRYPLDDVTCRDRFEETTLLTGLSDTRFSFFDGETGTEWLTRWVGTRGLPALIQVSLIQGNSDQNTELVIRPQIEADISCRFDPISRRCRRQ